VRHVIDPVGDGPPHGVGAEIVHVDTLCTLTPGLARVLEVADQLFLLGVNTNGRLTSRLMLGPLLPQVTKLAIAVGMLLPVHLLDVDPQAVVMLLEQATDHRSADAVTLVVETVLDISQPAVEPFLAAHGIPGGVGGHQLQNQSFEGRVFFSAR